MDEAKPTRRQVNFRLSEEEAAKVMRSAENAGLSLSAYVKKLAVSSKVKPLRGRPDGANLDTSRQRDKDKF